MSKPEEFQFGEDSVARNYNTMLVPVLFEPWAIALAEERADWEGRTVLDLATGTGAVARVLADRVGRSGKVIGADINPTMLAQAKKRLGRNGSSVELIESPASPLDLPDGSVDTLVCQQGFQFFPDRGAACEEMYRVLREGGDATISTWKPVAECEIFGAMCGTLEEIGETEIADLMRVPFDHMPTDKLAPPFEAAGFANVEVTQQEQPIVFNGGIEHAREFTLSTPVGPKIRALPEEKRAAYRSALTDRLSDLTDDGVTMGRMVSNQLTAKK